MTEAPDLQVAREAYLVPVDRIDVGERLRPVDPVWVEGLAALMRDKGQEAPIRVHPKPQGRFGLIAGGHRLAAARALGWTQIDAFVTAASASERKAGEISENLFRLDLNALARAAFVAEQIELERARRGVAEDVSGRSVSAKTRWSDRLKAEAQDASDIMSHAYGWTEAVAEKIGLTRRTIERDLELHRGIRPDVAEAIRGLPVAGNAAQLRALARLPEGEQRLIAGLIVEGQAKDVTSAAGILKQKPRPDPVKKAWSAIVGGWGRLAGRDRKGVLRQLAEAGLPRGVTLVIDGETFGDRIGHKAAPLNDGGAA